MEKSALLESLNDLVARYEQHRAFVDKARTQSSSGKFNSAVVEKVIRDHEARSAEVAGQVGPLLPQLRAVSDRLDAEKQDIQSSKTGIDERVQEAELRNAIGELSDEDLDAAVGQLRETLAEQNARIEAIDADLDEIADAIQRWANLAAPNGHFGSERAAPRVERPAPVAPPPAPVAPAPVAPPEEPEPVAEEDVEVGPHAHRTEIRDDVSAVFDAGMEASRNDDDIAIETGEINEAAAEAPAADVQFGFEEDILGADAPAQAEFELDLGAAAASQPAAEPEKSSDAPRRALLLYQEGTAEEQIYPFTGDALTIGRGRENDIQIKNDSKVSRYHCKLYRRGNNFYIEDAKSSNGTLVNGELITDRRLFGGEEVIVGETFFRFRIMD